MNHPRILLDHNTLYANQRVYVKALDVFGRVNAATTHVICEPPMSGYLYEIEKDSVLYHDAIGDRDSLNDS